MSTHHGASVPQNLSTLPSSSAAADAPSRDILLQLAEQHLPPFLAVTVRKYVNGDGLDETEYPMLVSSLACLTGSSPTGQQLLAARSLCLAGASHDAKGARRIIWETPPINAWYAWVVKKTAQRPPPHLYRAQDRDTARRDMGRAIDGDASELLEKVKRYMTMAPRTLGVFCELAGLEQFRLKSEVAEQGHQQQATEDKVATEPQAGQVHSENKTIFCDRKQPDPQPESDSFARGKRQLDDVDMEQRDTKRFRGYEEVKEKSSIQDDQYSSCSTITAYSTKARKPNGSNLNHQSHQKDNPGFAALLAAAGAHSFNSIEDHQIRAPKPVQLNNQNLLSGFDALVAAADVLLAAKDTMANRIGNSGEQYGDSGGRIRASPSLMADSIDREEEDFVNPDFRRHEIETWAVAVEQARVDSAGPHNGGGNIERQKIDRLSHCRSGVALSNEANAQTAISTHHGIEEVRQTGQPRAEDNAIRLRRARSPSVIVIDDSEEDDV